MTISHSQCCYMYVYFSDLLLEATECLLIPKRKSQIQNHRVIPRRPTSVNQVLYAIGGMSRREASKSGEKFDPREGKWKPMGRFRNLIVIRNYSNRPCHTFEYLILFNIKHWILNFWYSDWLSTHGINLVFCSLSKYGN